MNKFLATLFTLAALDVSATTLLLENFEEADGIAGGSLAGQNGWAISGGSATVQSTVVQDGAQALEMGEATIAHELASGQSNLWIRFQARISAPPDSTPALPPGNTSLAFFVGANQHLFAYSNAVPVDLGVPMPLNEWTRFDVYCDYEAQVWNLSMDGITIGAALPLYSTNTAIDSVQIANHSASATYFDRIEITDHEQASGAPDSNLDGVPDWWEIKHFGAIGIIDASGPCGNDGLTYHESYIAGVSPFVYDPFIAEQVAPNSLRWIAQPGRLYSIQWAPSLSESFVTIATVSWPNQEYTDGVYGNDLAGFYRLKVGMQ